MTRFLSSRCRLVLLSLAVVWLVGGCATTEDARTGYRHDLWWLGANSPDTTRWPANDQMELAPMTNHWLPERTPTPATPSPGWPPL
ncbi:MAG: hypothetical protein LBB65_07440 [Burkholderiales bacterium]|jgi:hypothetical protein|nr:hypothetical protein [Burkholderiales bacterium]